ncbi:MAG: hypothetical protein R3280_06070 [Marinobacter sp.]|uniref:hypothetical protein n=1 Tax=Marinobacter sp. TaxID=50741 RepID=UPI00299E12E1|nr:hypothetical protein [Marinobacter sp.]MDX1634181.1 hypothetical protein [Marinobacter sp.]
MPSVRTKPLLPSIALSVLSLTGTLALSGCAGGLVTGTTYGAAGTAATALHLERQALREDLQEDYQQYRELFQDSRCAPDQYEISPEILEYVRESAPTERGYAQAQDLLLEIYRDTTLQRDIRAHALYLAALAEAQREGGSLVQAREYLQAVKTQFPGSHDCAVNKLLKEGHRID